MLFFPISSERNLIDAKLEEEMELVQGMVDGENTLEGVVLHLISVSMYVNIIKFGIVIFIIIYKSF